MATVPAKTMNAQETVRTRVRNRIRSLLSLGGHIAGGKADSIADFHLFSNPAIIIPFGDVIEACKLHDLTEKRTRRTQSTLVSICTTPPRRAEEIEGILLSNEPSEHIRPDRETVTLKRVKP